MAILDLFFPKKCLECNSSGKYICENCLKKVPPRGWTNREAYSCFRYEGVIRKAIIALKYKYSSEIAKELAEVCVQNLYATRFSLSATLVPVPLHWHRKNFRGFNQSEEVGKLMAKGMGWEFIPDLLIRKKSTIPQVQLTGSARRQNMHGVFVLNPHYSLPRSGKLCLSAVRSPLVLFDDVLTTGSTLLEASKVLRSSGIARILRLTIAK